MSEPEVRIKVKVSENEFEVSGKESAVSRLLDKRLAKVLSAFETAILSTKPSSSDRDGRGLEVKDSTRDAGKQDGKKVPNWGGKRVAFISPAIQKLISKRWFDQRRTVSEIVQQLKSGGTPGPTNKNVLAACKRLVGEGPDQLRTTTEEGRRVFWTERA